MFTSFQGTAQEWDVFVGKADYAPFLQSYAWGEFQKSVGRRVWRFVNESGSCAIQIIANDIRYGIWYAYVPFGLVSHCSEKEHQWLAEYFRAQGALFLRFDNPSRPIEQAGKVKGSQPEATILIDCAREEDVLLSAMHSKTRYNIRLAEKKGVIAQAHFDAALTDEVFYSWYALLERTAKRDAFSLHSSSYYRAMRGALPGLGVIAAYLDGIMIAGVLVLRFGDTVTYLHGGSDYEHRAYMAPYLLQWRAMQYAKSVGAHWYDMWGVAPRGVAAGHPLEGVTRFKEGFGGEYVIHEGAYDIPLSPFGYGAYTFLRRIL